jgi:hypothetical protein
MESLFALGLVSLSWRALVAALIANEKALRRRRVTLIVARALFILTLLCSRHLTHCPGSRSRAPRCDTDLSIVAAHPDAARTLTML